jgi:class II lanthipeptide synthase
MGGQVQHPHAFLDNIIEGFERAHHFLARTKEEFVKPGGILDTFGSKRARLIPRPTIEYAAVLARSVTPEPLCSVGARHLCLNADLDYLSRERLDSLEDGQDAEAADLFAFDIPRFEVPANETATHGFKLLSAPLESARARLSALDDFDLTLQHVTIQQCLQPRPASNTHAPETFPASHIIEQKAIEIVSSIVAAVQSRAGEPFWVFTQYSPAFGSTMVHADRESLYEGGAGTALVIAEAGRITGEEDWCRLAAAQFGPVARGETPKCVQRSGGLGRGLGGLLYAVTRTAEACQYEELLDVAVRIAEEYAASLAENDPLDENGRAGSIGPLRLDIGVPVNRRSDVDDIVQVYVSIGQAY